MILAFKGFDKDLSCTSGGNRFQYLLGVWNHEPEANCAKNGFHCAENPLDCLSYYPNWEHSVYYMVLADGDIDEDAYDSKISCTRIKLVKQLDIGSFIAHSLNYICDHPYRKDNCHICREKGVASGGFAIVRGKNPIVKGKTGDVLGVLLEEPGSRKISEIGLFIVDDKEILPDTWYNVKGTIHGKELMAA